mmetsp:Transcript_4518/g.13406  ORF Transcript_4518/g.13406 Transcript_4518/m.13406 type:complete len:204 (-) Transcript_4518:452-1063(-)
MPRKAPYRFLSCSMTRRRDAPSPSSSRRQCASTRSASFFSSSSATLWASGPERSVPPRNMAFIMPACMDWKSTSLAKGRSRRRPSSIFLWTPSMSSSRASMSPALSPRHSQRVERYCCVCSRNTYCSVSESSLPFAFACFPSANSTFSLSLEISPSLDTSPPSILLNALEMFSMASFAWLSRSATLTTAALMPCAAGSSISRT